MSETFATYLYPTTKLTVTRARIDCRDFLAHCDYPTNDTFADELALIVDELVTNAVTHGRVPGTSGRQIRLTLTRIDDNFRIEVRDGQSDRMPELRKPEPDDADGRGLLLVDSLASTWGVNDEIIGKTVWAEKSQPCPDPSLPSAG